MKKLVLLFIYCVVCSVFSQETEDVLLAQKKANNYVYDANGLVNDDFVAAEMAYRKALSQQADNVAGMYNLGNSYYDKGNFEEALYRHQQTAKMASSKEAKHKAFHNIGNILMKNKKCKEAVEAYKNALRNNPSDDETRYNFALAKECAKQQEEENKNDENKDDKDNSEDKKDENKENKDENKDENKEDNKDNKDENEDNKDKGDDKEEDKKPEDKEDNKDKKDENKENKGDKDKEDKKKPQPQPGKLSPQQIKSLLEAMNNEEQKVQEKMNEKKQKGVKIQTDKDW